MALAAHDLLLRAHQARREHRLTDAHADLVEAVALWRRTGTRRELVQSLKALGQIEWDLRHADAALPLYEEAVALCRAEGDPLLLAHTVRHLGDIHRHAGRADLAEPCYHEAIRLYRGQADTAALDLANALRPLALLKLQTAAADELKRLWAEARQLYAVAQVPEAVAECDRRLAQLGE